MSRGNGEADVHMALAMELIRELSEQLNANKALVDQLKASTENVKGQVVHVGTGFPLRRFNLDISDEEFQTELEAFAAHLVLENQQLQHENKQLNTLLKEYEQTLESVMSKFRGVAHASQQHDLSLHSYYTSLLQTLQTAYSSAYLHDNTSLSLLLTRLSTLLRSALRSLGGEEAEAGTELLSAIPALLHESTLLNGHNGEAGSSHSADPSSSSGPPSPTSSAGARRSTLQRAPNRPTPFGASLPGASGGYAGTEGQADWALEREMEILRLEEENKALRDMLGISEELAALDETAKEDEPSADETEAKSPAPEDLGRRKSSLTIQELEAGAEHEDSARRRAREIDDNQEDPVLEAHREHERRLREHDELIEMYNEDDRQRAAAIAAAGEAERARQAALSTPDGGGASETGDDGFESVDISDSAISLDAQDEAGSGSSTEALLPITPNDDHIESAGEGTIKGGHGLVAPPENEAPEAEPVIDEGESVADDVVEDDILSTSGQDGSIGETEPIDLLSD